MYDLMLVFKLLISSLIPSKLSLIIRYILKTYVILKFYYFENCRFPLGTGLAQSVQRLATSWTVRGSIPVWGDIFRTLPDRPWGPSILPYNGYRVFFSGRKAAGAWC